MEKRLSAQDAARRMAATLSRRPAGLITDIDGTISRIARLPTEAYVEPAARLGLARLTRSLDLVATVTGRAARDGAHMVGVEGVVCIGNHGMERWEHGREVVVDDVLPFVPRVREALSQVRSAIDDAWLIVEDKVATGSLHFRQAPDPVAAEREVMAVIGPIAAEHGLCLTHGRMLIEVRPPVSRSKGTAVAELIDRYRLRSVAFLGDDVTDLDGMRCITSLRERTKLHGFNVGVVGKETPQAVSEQADIVLPDVESVAEALLLLASFLER